MEGGSRSGAQTEDTPPMEGICNLRTHKFKDIVHTAAFVDKTLFIKAFLEADDTMIMITAPRRICKSTNLDMVKEFLSGNTLLFKDNNLKIYKDQTIFFNENCKENPVIHVDMKKVSGETKDRILETMGAVIGEAYEVHNYLIKRVEENWAWSDEKLEYYTSVTIERFVKYWKTSETLSEHEVIVALRHLSQCLHVYHDKPVYVLMDESDSPIIQAIFNYPTIEDEVLTDIINTIGAIMSSLFKDNNYVKRGLIMASVRIGAVLSGEANNMICYEFLTPEFAPYFGFTADEVENLFNRKEFIMFKDDKVQEWYYGYEDIRIYSSYSILRYLKKSTEDNQKKFDNFCVDTGTITCMKELFIKPPIDDLIEDLIEGEEIVINTLIKKFCRTEILDLKQLVHGQLNPITTAEADLFLEFLLHNGYLNMVTSPSLFEATIKIPSIPEIKSTLIQHRYDVDLIEKNFQLDGGKIKQYQQALESVLTVRDKNAFISFAISLSNLFDGAKMPSDENELHCILYTLAYNVEISCSYSEFNVERIKPKRRPRGLDIFIVLDCVGLIIELKFKSGSSERAYTHIKAHKYYTAFDRHKGIKNKIRLGLHMNEKRIVQLSYSVNNSAVENVNSEPLKI